VEGIVFVQLTNGFGNNIFQYVAARLLAEHHQKEVMVVPPTEDYYAIACLKKLGITFFEEGKFPSNMLVIDDAHYVTAYDEQYRNHNFFLRGYFEDYQYYLPHRNRIKGWFPACTPREDNALVVHMRTGDRLFMKNEFYTKPRAANYLAAMSHFDFNELHIVSDIPTWDYITEKDLNTFTFHVNIDKSKRVPASESVAFFNELVDEFQPFNPIMKKRSILEDFEHIRSFKNILFEHGTLSWWAAFLSEAEKVGVYGPWRAFKGTKNKNLSQIPLSGWFKWE